MNRKKRFTLICAMLLCFSASAQPVFSQNCIGLGGSNPVLYTQNFNGLGTSAAPQNGDSSNISILNAANPRRYFGKFENAVADNGSIITVFGWGIFEEGTSIDAVTGRYAAGNGSADNGNTYSFGSTAADRALGSLTENDTWLNYIGGCFENTGLTTVGLAKISYTGEVWRYGGQVSAVDKLDFQYTVDNSYSPFDNIYTANNGSFNDFDSLDFEPPVTTVGLAGTRNGNLSTNKKVFLPETVGVFLNPGDRLYVRWRDQNVVGMADDGLAIDDFSIEVSAVPTAARVSITGRALTSSLQGIPGAGVTLVDSHGIARTAKTNSFGYYRFDDLESGEICVIYIQSKRYQFEDSPQVLQLDESLEKLDFIASPL